MDQGQMQWSYRQKSREVSKHPMWEIGKKVINQIPTVSKSQSFLQRGQFGYCIMQWQTLIAECKEKS